MGCVTEITSKQQISKTQRSDMKIHVLITHLLCTHAYKQHIPNTHPIEKEGGLTFSTIPLQSFDAVCLSLEHTQLQPQPHIFGVFIIFTYVYIVGLTVAKCKRSSPSSFFIFRSRLTTARQGPHHCWYTSTTTRRDGVCLCRGET